MSARESYGVGGGGGDILSSQASMQNMHLAYSADGTTLYKPTLLSPISSSPSSTTPIYAAVSGEGSLVAAAAQPSITANSSEPAKRRRGRPRKYVSDGSMAPGLTTPLPPTPSPLSQVPLQSTPVGAEVPSSSPGKKSRGRPPGSGRKKQVAALGSAGAGFTPHVITVKAGEDVLAKLMSFSQNNTRAVCVLSANGAISNVTLRQASMSGGSVTYEGRFEILSLSGSFLLSECGGQRSRTGGLSVSLAGPDGRVLGGGVTGLLTAAAPVQVIVGSFITGDQKRSKSGQAEGLIAGPKLVSGAAVAAGSSPSHGTLSESSGGPGSPLNQSTGACNNSNPPGMASMPWR